MKKPLFPATKEVTVSGNARQIRYAHHLTSWLFLTNIWLGFPPTVKELKQLIIVESEGRNRPYMLKRLVARLHTLERDALYNKLGL